MGVKTHLSAALLAAAFSAPALAQGLEPCAQPFSSAVGLFDALKAEGWHTTEADLTEQLAWINAVAYVGGDMGGATLAEVIAGQRMAAANYGRLKPLPTSETRILTDGENVMVASWQKPVPTVTTVQCRVALLDPEAVLPEGYGAHFEAKISDEMPGLSEYRFRYNPDAIRADLPGAQPPDVVVNIRHEFIGEASE